MNNVETTHSPELGSLFEALSKAQGKIDNAIKDFDKRLQNYVTENLKELGFEFENDSELMEFISKRVHRIGFENRPNEWELYVDYQTENQKLIGTYNDNVSFSYEGSKVTATFGRSVGDKLQTKE